MSSVNKDNFISLSSICITFISFSCLIALARPSSIMLNITLNIRMDICVAFFILGEKHAACCSPCGHKESDITEQQN